MAPCEALSLKGGINVFEPCSSGLLQPIDGFLQLALEVLLAILHKPWGWSM